MTIHDTTALLSKGASVKLLSDMLAQAETEKRELLEALAAAKVVLMNRPRLYREPWEKVAAAAEAEVDAAIAKGGKA